MAFTIGPRLAILLGVLQFGIGAAATDSAQAREAFPVRPVRMIVPFAPGGGSDIVGRILAQGLNERWGQAVVVDNRPGAGSTVGTSLAARAGADGYTVLVSSSAIALSPALYKRLGYDITHDFASLSLLARQPSILAVAGDVSARSVQELIELAKSQRGKLTFGSAGTGSATHLGGEYFAFSAGIEMTHVPYKSAGLAMTALLAGEIQVLLTNTATVIPHLKTGRIRALATSGRTRNRLIADLPTVIESGLSDFEYDTWYALLAPSAIRSDIAAHLHDDTVRVMTDAKYAQHFAGLGIDIIASAPAVLGEYLKAEILKWGRVMRAAGLKPQ